MTNQTVDDKLTESDTAVALLEPPERTKSSDYQTVYGDAGSRNEFIKEVFENIMVGGNNSLYSRFCSFTHRFIKNYEEVEEVVQKAMIKMYEYRDKYDMTRPFTPWAFTVLANCAKDYLRKKKRNKERCISQTDIQYDNPSIDDKFTIVSKEDSVAPSSEEICINMEKQEMALTALAGLKDKYRKIIRLRELESLSYKEVAESLGVPIGTVKSRLYTAKGKLTEAYNDLNPNQL